MTTLRELQRVFADAARGKASAEALQRELRGDPDRAGVRARVYREGYFTRLCDVLRDDYPKVAFVLGDGFLPTARAYVRQHPSEHPSLRHFGRHFAEFLRSAGSPDAPWLAELARLEWARIEAFDTADRATMSFDELRGLPEDAWPTLRLELVPSFRYLELEWNVCDVWLALDEERPVPSVEREPTHVAVWRSGFVVRHRPCAPAETRAIGRLESAAPFAAVCDCFAGSGTASLDEAAEHAFRALGQWLADGWLAAVRPPTVERQVERNPL